MEEEREKEKKKHSTKPFNRKSKKANLYSVCQSKLEGKELDEEKQQKKKKTKQQIKHRIII